MRWVKIRVAVTGLYSGDSMKMKSETRPQQDIIFQIETDEEDGQEVVKLLGGGRGGGRRYQFTFQGRHILF